MTNHVNIVHYLDESLYFDSYEAWENVFEWNRSRHDPGADGGGFVYAFGEAPKRHHRFDPALTPVWKMEVMYWLDYIKSKYENAVSKEFDINFLHEFDWSDYALAAEAPPIFFTAQQMAFLGECIEVDDAWLWRGRDVRHFRRVLGWRFGALLPFGNSWWLHFGRGEVGHFRGFLEFAQNLRASAGKDKDDECPSVVKINRVLRALQALVRVGSAMDMKFRYYFGQGVPSLFELSAGRCRGGGHCGLGNLRYKIDY